MVCKFGKKSAYIHDILQCLDIFAKLLPFFFLSFLNVVLSLSFFFARTFSRARACLFVPHDVLERKSENTKIA